MENNNKKAWLYLIPAAVFLGLFMVYPLIDVFIYSFEEGYNSASQTFRGIGLYNYMYVLRDPYFIQALSSEVFESVIARGGRSVRPDDILAAADSLTEMKREQYETVVGELSSAQRSLLSALAASPTNRFDEAYRRKYGIGPSSTVHGALEKLVDKGHVEKTAHGYFVGDPFFARYLTALPYEIVTGK